MAHFEYERPSIVEISEEELDEIAAVLSSGGSSQPSGAGFEDCILQISGFLDGTIGHTIEQFAALVDSKYGGAASIKSAWMFFRVLGGFSYNGEFIENAQWDNVAGPLPYSSGQDGGAVVPESEESFFLDTLGMSQLRYRVLRFYIRLQHSLCSMQSLSQATKDSSKEIFFNTLGSFGDFYYTNKAGKRVKITRKSYDDFLEMNYAKMKGKCDFSHLCITAAAVLAHKAGFSLSAANAVVTAKFGYLCARCSADDARCDLSGWLGDACLISGGAAAVSMSNDDYFADMDSALIALSVSSLGYKGAIENHYNKLRSTSRRSLFLSEYLSFSEVANRMRLTFAGGVNMTNDQWVAAISVDSRFADTLRFYRILEGTIAEPSL